MGRRGLGVDILTEEPRPVGYKSFGGIAITAFLLCLIIFAGFASFYLKNTTFFQFGGILIGLIMVLDFFLVHPRVLRNKWYVAHHLITMFWASLIFFKARSLVNAGLGLLTYMAFGALFRRLWLLSRFVAPGKPVLHKGLYAGMVFFEFCDPLVIILLWDFLSSLPLGHQFSYFGLVVIRLAINLKSYREDLKSLWEKSPLGRVRS